MGACAAPPRRGWPGFRSRGGGGRHVALFNPRRKPARFWMRRLMEVIASNRIDLTPLVTHRVKLDEIEKAYDLFSHQRDGVLKVAITP
jgi:threonine dehydrogenase-like Zn-dependent dehydrogenase